MGVITFGRYVTDYELRANDEWLAYISHEHSLCFYGERGSGKDMLMCHMMNCCRQERHYSNIDYGGLTIKIQEKKIDPVTKAETVEYRLTAPKDLDIGGNTIEEMNEGKYHRFKSKFEKRCDQIISDIGIFLACQNDAQLNKLCSELAAHMALRRQLLRSNIHINGQIVDRTYKKVREHYNHFINCLGVEEWKKGFFIRAIFYHIISAPDGVSRAELERLGVAHTEIKEKIFYAPKEYLTYDTHYFGTMLLDEEKEPPPPKRVSPLDYYLNK